MVSWSAECLEPRELVRIPSMTSLLWFGRACAMTREPESASLHNFWHSTHVYYLLHSLEVLELLRRSRFAKRTLGTEEELLTPTLRDRHDP
jgi:hypothetical protein